nr:MAG TPA: anaerobic ribonucleoside triphosphate reductase [Caudoviricetes sp.]
MFVDIKLDNDFAKKLEELKEKYGEEFVKLNGLSQNYLNFTDFIDNFIDSENTANSTIDANANVQSKDICNLINEIPKPFLKLLGLNKVYYETKKQYGIDKANELLEAEWNGNIFIHNGSDISFRPYCFNYDLEKLATKGMYFIGNIKTKPAKHLSTFCDHLLEFISWVSNRQSGAAGIANALMWLFWFWKNDVDNGHYLKSPKYYRDQCFQKFCFDLNMPYLRIAQAAYTNVSIYDKTYCMEMFGGFVYPDGKLFVDYVDEFIEFQKAFMRRVSELRKDNVFTYPVLTYCLVFRDGKFQDEEFAKWCSTHNMEWADSNFLISPDTTSAASCPLSGDTDIIYWSDFYKEFKVSSIKEIYFNKYKNNQVPIITTLSNGQEIKCKINKFNVPIEYEIALVNGERIKTTANHLNKVYGKDYVPTKELTTNDYLPYGLNMYQKYSNMSYEDGYLIGMFLGDGSYKNKNEIVFSLNEEKKQEAVDFLSDYCTKKYNAKISKNPCKSQLSGKYSCVNISVKSLGIRGLISQFVNGNSALTKSLNYSFLTCSADFRRGIIDGLYITDGGNSNRIYTSSKEMVKSLKVLFSSLGMVCHIDEDNRPNRLGKNTCYTIRYYTTANKTKMKDIYILDDEYFWVKIKSIKIIKNKTSDTSYCLEVLDDVEPIFTLGNGIITHNCRLLSDTSKLTGVMNSIGGSTLDIGSVSVITLNLAGFAYQSKSIDDFFNILTRYTNLVIEGNNVIRGIIKRNVEKGILPNYSYELMRMEKQFSTIGLNGLWEAVKHFGLAKQDDFGYWYYTDEGTDFASQILDKINEIKDSYEFDYSINVEQTPMENGAIKVAAKNKLLYNSEDYITGNQWIALRDKATIQERTKIAGILDNKCGGGCISHIQIDAPFNNEDTAWNMLNYIAKQGVIYFAFNLKINMDKEKHSFTTKTCPICGSTPTDTYQRVVGYLVPSSSWSEGRKRELSERDWLNLNDVIL